MSRPLRHFLPVACATVSLGFTACVGTIYDRTYSYQNTHFKAPPEKKEMSAAELLKSLEAKKTPAGGAQPEGLGLPPGGDVPGLPPAMPGVPGEAPMIPGLPPAAPPPVPPPAN